MEIKGPNNISAPLAIGPGLAITASSAAPNTQTNPPVINTVQLSSLLALLQEGQQLTVWVAAVADHRLLLQLKDPLIDAQGNRTWVQFRAPLSIPLQVGQRLLVQIVDANPAQPVLKLIDPLAASRNLQTALQTAVGKQQTPTLFYANITQLNQPPADKLLQNLPATVRDQIQMLWRQLPEPAQLNNAQAIKQALRYSGGFLEANLLHSVETGRTLPALDVRSTLLRLAAALRQHVSNELPTVEPHTTTTGNPNTEPTPRGTFSATTTTPTASTEPQQAASKESNGNKAPHPHVPQAYPRETATLLLSKTSALLLEQLYQQTERTLAHLQTLQLHTANNETHRPTWAMELPIRHGEGVDLFDVRVQPDGKHNDKEGARSGWTVMLAFDLDGLGPLRVQVSLYNNSISTFWWAEQAPTVTLFQQHMETLKARLATSGLTVDQVRCQTGLTTHETVTKPILYSNISIDELI